MRQKQPRMRDHATTWFAAILLFESRINGIPALRPLCEERVVLFRAQHERKARTDARAYAKGAEHEYKNVRGERVTWTFVRVEYLTALDEPQSQTGWEVASRFVRKSQRTLLSERD